MKITKQYFYSKFQLRNHRIFLLCFLILILGCKHQINKESQKQKINKNEHEQVKKEAPKQILDKSEPEQARNELENLAKLLNDYPDLNLDTKVIFMHPHQVDSLPDDIAKLKELKMLRMVYGTLKYVSPKIGELHNLEELYFGCNELESLPSSIGNLQNLQHIFLGGNNIQQLPNGFYQLKNVLRLGLSDIPLGNEGLSKFAQNFAGVDSLGFLVLSNTNLSRFPTELSKFKNLRFLDLTANPIKTIPKEIAQFERLEGLKLDATDIKSLPDELFELKYLKHLYLNIEHFSEEEMQKIHARLPKVDLRFLKPIRPYNSCKEQEMIFRYGGKHFNSEK